jgi:hypothetical protein
MKKMVTFDLLEKVYGSGLKENSRDDFILSFQGKDTSIDTSNRFNQRKKDIYGNKRYSHDFSTPIMDIKYK